MAPPAPLGRRSACCCGVRGAVGPAAHMSSSRRASRRASRRSSASSSRLTSACSSSSTALMAVVLHSCSRSLPE
eukprot:scaffold10508_cov54-Phaeocystis_antarctica.AAC.1